MALNAPQTQLKHLNQWN